MNKIKSISLVTIASLGSFAFAEGSFDVTAAVSSFQTDALAAISAIGIAMITVAGVAVGIKWAKAAMFG